MKLKLAIAGLAVFLNVGAFLYHGHVQYQKGYSKSQDDCVSAGIAANENGRKEKTKNETKYKSMEIGDIDSIGHSRGWVRKYEDR